MRTIQVLLGVIIAMLLAFLLPTLLSVNGVKTTLETIKEDMKNINESINEMVTDIAIIKDRTRNLLAQGQVTPEEGGELTSWGGLFKATVPPGAVTDDLILSHESKPVEMLPDPTLAGFRFVSDGSILTPYRFGEPLLDLVFGEPIQISIPYTQDDLDLAGGILENLVIQHYDDSLNLWIPLDSRAKPDETVVSAEAWEPGLFALTARVW